MTGGWLSIAAPLDSSGAGRGEERGPRALLAAGLGAAFNAADGGEVARRLGDPCRDSGTGIISFDDLCAASAELRETVADALNQGRRPLVLGGDCTLLIGALAGAREIVGQLGLWFVDGHADFFDGESSPTGEAADMELAMLTGHGPSGLVALTGFVPLVDPGSVVILGHRPAELNQEVAAELARVHEAVATVSADEIASIGARRVGEEWTRRLAARGPVWLHLDLDALDEEVMPAVTYPQPHGLDWDSFVSLIRPMLRSEQLMGVSVADLEADLDPAGTFATRVTEAIAEALEPGL